MKATASAILTATLMAFLPVSNPSHAATFDVQTQADLQPALDEAATNGEPDILNIGAGTWSASGSAFSYVAAAGENFSLTINGSGADSTILDGGSTDLPLSIDTTGVAGSDADADINVIGIAFQNGNNPSGPGGGLFIQTTDADISVDRCVFNDNSAGTLGGGAFVETAALGGISVTRSHFTGNHSDGYIGGVEVSNFGTGDLLFSRNTVTGNTADQNTGGADVATSFGSVEFTGNILIENVAAGSIGGGNVFTRGNISMTNNVILRNTAGGEAGGFDAEILAATADIANNTISDNSAGGDGGGIVIRLDADSAVADVYNNIVWGNAAAGDGDDIFVEDDFNGVGAGSLVTLSHNDFTGLFCTGVCGGNFVESDSIDADPVFVDAAGSDLRLQSGSPAIDAGTSSAPGLPAADLDGNPRTFGSDTDLGAYEAVPVLEADPSDIDFGTVSTGADSQRSITLANTGNHDLLITAMSLTDATNYSLDLNAGDAPCGSATPILAAGQSCEIGVNFGPESEGPHDANLEISSNDPNVPALTVALSGTAAGGGGGCQIIEATPASAWLWCLALPVFAIALGGRAGRP